LAAGQAFDNPSAFTFRFSSAPAPAGSSTGAAAPRAFSADLPTLGCEPGQSVNPETDGELNMITLTLDAVVRCIRQWQDATIAQAVKAVNTSLTLRDRAIGYYIEEYERRGADRGEYVVGGA
jgi:hypothetical protein